MKSSEERVLIVGAGPSGLAAALFLHERGIKARIVDKKEQVSDQSRALGVNPRTLSLLESSGLTQRFLENGRKMLAVNIHRGDKHLYRNDLTRIRHKYAFMLVQSQKDSEVILREELEKRGVSPEFGVECTGLNFADDVIRAGVTGGADAQCDYVIGADGARGRTREQIGVEYRGFTYEEDWELFDVELNTKLHPDEAHIRGFDEGGMIMIRVHQNVWRVAGNLKDILNYLPAGTKTGAIPWESSFRISHKVAASLTRGNVMLIGDAAHLHSPLGARGMNLGIEDAYIAAELLAAGRTADYSAQRLPYLRRTVAMINRMTTAMTSTAALPRFLRARTGLARMVLPIAMPFARRFALGLNG